MLESLDLTDDQKQLARLGLSMLSESELFPALLLQLRTEGVNGVDLNDESKALTQIRAFRAEEALLQRLQQEADSVHADSAIDGDLL